MSKQRAPCPGQAVYALNIQKKSLRAQVWDASGGADVAQCAALRGRASREFACAPGNGYLPAAIERQLCICQV